MSSDNEQDRDRQRHGCSARMPERIATHPCYSEEAHHHFARMHLAVAPACNIQCNYCNRKYDCANESRPGVTSERLTPGQAAEKVRAVRARLPNLSVVGIAGPGDPLASPERTFRTFELVSEIAPELHLCLSTNGLMLSDYIEKILHHGIHHVTITINAVDPEIGEQIYPWVVYRRSRLTGRSAAELLLERQIAGLELLRSHGILCKVNSVLIPGINDEHIIDVHRTVMGLGAFIHNIMPLISSPEHGTYYGLNGQRGATDDEVKSIQDRLTGSGRLMKHCRQCRADAVGLLGKDLSSEFSLKQLSARSPRAESLVTSSLFRDENPKIRVAVATHGQGLINEHFGQADEFDIFDVSSEAVTFSGRRRVEPYCLGGHGDSQALAAIKTLLGDCHAIFVARVGEGPRRALHSVGTELVERYAGQPIESSLRDFFQSRRSEKVAGTALTRNPVVKSNQV